jgi:dTDP-4-amino-4,6-dideoxygalactose transaminase
MDGLQASILTAKLPHLATWTHARQRLAAAYDRLLAGVGDLQMPAVAAGREHVYHLYVIRTARRDGLRAHLAEAGIATQIHYPKALPFCPAYAHLGHAPEDFPVAYSNQARILSLPIYPEMSSGMVEHIADQVQGFFA